MPKESPANATPLAARQDVSVTNEIDVTNRLDAHHTCKAAVFLLAPEYDASGDLAIELLPRHVGLVPAIGRDHTTISFGRGVDDRKDGCPIVVLGGVVARENGSEPVAAS